jgi:outer membrane protein assembly factor BamB
MKRVVVAALLFGTMATPLFAQVPYRVITRPKIPSQDVIERLGLAFGWYARVPLDSPRDSVYSVQVIPRGTGEAIKTEVVVQTVAGAIYLFDGETGTLRWNTPVGIPYGPMHQAAFNSQSIIVTRGATLFVLHRDTGLQRVYKKSATGRTFGLQLDALPSAAPAANDESVVFSFPDRVVAYALPDFDRIATAQYKDPSIIAEEKEGSLQPLPLWDYYDPTMKLTAAPVITPIQITVTTPDGRVISLAPGQQAKNRLRFEYRLPGALTASMGVSGDFGYIGGQDSFLYALDLERERLVWRFASGAPILRRPAVNDADVFVVSQGRGMSRVHRFTGESYWLEPAAERFLAAHYFKGAHGKFKVDRQDRVLAKYVYAADRFGRLLILDGDRGGVLAQFDSSDWQTPIDNEWTDRLYLGNNDGQIVCLRPRDSRPPQVNKSILLPRPAGDDRAAPVVAPVIPSPKKDEEKKVEEKNASNARPQRLRDDIEWALGAAVATARMTWFVRHDRIMTTA